MSGKALTTLPKKEHRAGADWLTNRRHVAFATGNIPCTPGMQFKTSEGWPGCKKLMSSWLIWLVLADVSDFNAAASVKKERVSRQWRILKAA
ncbi:MAG: hypothetical protein ACI910_000225 [Oleispira sp.]|jgi:hypothetical protein